MPVCPSLVKHCSEHVVACAQYPRVRGYPFSEGVISHEEYDVTSVLVLVKIVSPEGRQERTCISNDSNNSNSNEDNDSNCNDEDNDSSNDDSSSGGSG